MVMEFTNGQTAKLMTDSGIKAQDKAKEFGKGNHRIIYMWEIGKTIKQMDMEHTLGQMVRTMILMKFRRQI